MVVRFLDEQPKTRVRFLDEPTQTPEPQKPAFNTPEAAAERRGEFVDTAKSVLARTARIGAGLVGAAADLPVIAGQSAFDTTRALQSKLGFAVAPEVKIKLPSEAAKEAFDAATGGIGKVGGLAGAADLAAEFGAAPATILAKIGLSVARRIPKIKLPSSDEIRQEAGRLYQKADKVGGTLSAKFTDTFLDDVDKITPQTKAGKLIAGDDPLATLNTRLQKLRGEKLTLADAQEVDEALGDIVDNLLDLGKPTKQGRKILEVQSLLRKSIDNATTGDVVGGKDGFAALKEGRQLWSKSAKMRDIENIITRAGQMDNPATGIKTGFRTLSNNPNRLRGYTTAEKKLIKDAAESGVVTDILRTFGSRLIPIGTTVAGGGVAGGALAQAGTAISRTAATKVQTGKALKILQEISAPAGKKKPIDVTIGSPLLAITAGQTLNGNR